MDGDRQQGAHNDEYGGTELGEEAIGMGDDSVVVGKLPRRRRERLLRAWKEADERKVTLDMEMERLLGNGEK